MATKELVESLYDSFTKLCSDAARTGSHSVDTRAAANVPVQLEQLRGDLCAFWARSRRMDTMCPWDAPFGVALAAATASTLNSRNLGQLDFLCEAIVRVQYTIEYKGLDLEDADWLRQFFGHVQRNWLTTSIVEAARQIYGP